MSAINTSMETQKLDINKDQKERISQELAKTNTQLSAQIKNYLPSETYSSVEVNNIKYDFNGLSDAVKNTRVISLNLLAKEKFASFFHGFFSGLGLVQDHKYEVAIDKFELEKEIVGVICQEKNACEQIKTAYSKSKTIKFYISEDLNNMELNLINSSAETVYRVVHNAKTIADYGFILFSAFSKKG